MATRTYQKGNEICVENSPGDEMYLIRSGQVKIKKQFDEDEMDLAILGDGDFFGEMALLLGGNRTATALTLEDTEVEILDKDDLLKQLQEDPTFAQTLLTTMAQRLRDAHELIANLEGMKTSLELCFRLAL